MFKKESLYINTVKQNNQLKIEYKKLSDSNIIETNSSNFKVQDDIMPLDIALKINSSQGDIEHSYISTLLFNDTTKLVKKEKASKLSDCNISNFNAQYKIAVLKNTLFETKNFFEKTGVDYIYSSFHLMNLYLEKNVCKNQLLLFLYDNKIYILLIDENGVIAYHKIEDIPSFDTVKKSHFYENEIEGQKLYDEIYYFELIQVIKNILEDFYKDENNTTFIESITILYALKQLSSQQIQTLSDELALKVEYIPINIDEYLLELSREVQFPKSFINPRKKKKKSNFIFAFILLLLLLAFFGLFKFYNYLELKKEEPQVEKIKSNTKLPDHVNINDKIYQRVALILHSIPYDVILDDLTLTQDSLKLNAKVLKEDTYIKSLKPQLEKFFKNNKHTVVNTDKKNNFTIKIDSSNPIDLADIKYRSNEKNYIKDEFIDIPRVKEQLKILMPKDSIIKFKSSKNGDLTQFIYRANILIKSPNDFLDLINMINNELYSINISYPIQMLKTPDGLEVSFNLVFNQVR